MAQGVECAFIVERPADIHAERAMQLPADPIESGWLRSARHQNQDNRQSNLPESTLCTPLTRTDGCRAGYVSSLSASS